MATGALHSSCSIVRHSQESQIILILLGLLGCVYRIPRVPASLTGFHFLLFCTDVERANSKEGCTGVCKDHQGTAAVLKKLEWNREKVL